MNVFWGLIAILAGILILIFPAIVAWIVGIWLIIAGILMVVGRRPPP